MIFFNDSRFITAALIFESIFIKMMLNRKQRCAQWIQNLTDQVSNTKIGKFVIGADSEEFDNDQIVRRSFRSLVDYILFISCIIIYSFMFKKLLPEPLKTPEPGPEFFHELKP